MTAALVRTAGAASVCVVDLNEDRLAFAETFGVDAAVTDAGRLGRTPGFEVVVDATGVIFLLFAGTTLLAFLFVQRLLPETKGRSLEEIEADLLPGRADRRGGAQTAPVSSEAGAAH
ncbi:MFS transporter [Streptomyces sirii]|uniref:MFS transporter n=1 Tax=Streptomyces sirii TaxID=3127701 RepID=UPI003D361520